MNQTNETVVNARKDGCGVELSTGWYSSFNALTPTPSRGDVVSFDYKEKEVGGRVYKNIIEKTFSVSGTESGTANAAVKSPAASYSRPNSGFPVPTDHGNRAINRQSAVAQAVIIMGQTHTDAQLAKLLKDEKYVEQMVDVARGIEAYTTGDLDSEIVKALIDSANADNE